LESTLGFCQITGESLHMEKLDLEAGEVILTGRIISLYYPDDTDGAKKGLFRRLFS
jgi:sporulation protein YabP